MTMARNISLSFQGVGFGTGRRRSFDAIAGANPPTITGGYAKWVNVDRPLARALTIFTGYDPVQMTTDIILGTFIDGWKTDDNTGRNTETAIDALEWMGGSNFRRGPSPAVYVWCYRSDGTQSDLIPPPYQSSTKPNGHRFPWVVSKLEWGQAWRNTNGYRVWQEATITLDGYMDPSVKPGSPKLTANGAYVTSAPGLDKPILIAASPRVHAPNIDHESLARDILNADQNNPCSHTSIRLRGKGVRFQIRHGVRVWVPSHHRN